MTIPLEKGLRELWKKGFQVSQAESVKKGIESVKQSCPGFAVVDLRLGDGNGLEVVKEIKIGPESRVIMLTGYGNIPTAVAAVKDGAIDYLAKPADAEDVEKALLADVNKKASPQKILCLLIELNGNIFIEFLNYVTEMYLRQQEDLKCIEELCKEFYQKDHLNKISNF